MGAMKNLISPPAIPTPKQAPVMRMPDAGSPSIKAAEDERRRRLMAQGGRASTNLAEPTGTATYNNTKLGS